MLLKIFIIAAILLSISMLGIGFKLLFKKPSKLDNNNCENDDLQNFGCGCGGSYCEKAP